MIRPSSRSSWLTRARATAARLTAQHRFDTIAAETRERLLTERAEARRPLVRAAYQALEDAGEACREVQRYDAETDAVVGRSSRDTFWVEFILSDEHHTSLYDFRRAGDEQEGSL